MNQAESTIPQIKKLQWQCRRGMLELDVILIPFLNEHFEELNADLKDIFEIFLKESDPDLYTWIMGFGQCENPDFKGIIQIIRDKMSIA